MSTNEVTQEMKPEITEETPKKNKKKFLVVLLLLALVVGVVGAAIGFGGRSSVSASQLESFLAKEGEDTITLDGDVRVSKDLLVNGQKTILGDGKIILVDELDGEWPEEGKNNSWGMGCAQLNAEETDGMSALLTVSEGATLTLSGNAVLDAGEKANTIQIEDGGRLIIENNVIVENGRYANIVVEKNATLEVNGGTIADALVHGIINKGTLSITGGTISGGKSGALLYNEGTATQSGGTIIDSKVHNVYVAAGTFTMTGGSNESALKDGVAVAENAEAIIEDGEIINCNHGICNNGNTEVGAITLNESGIMNYSTGTLALNGTTVDTAAVYCLANNGGKVVANDFTAAKCDTCAIYNFSGDMELNNVTVTGSRDGNIANAAGNLTVNGGTLEECNDKSIVVGNGKAVFNNVTLEGTSREKYGVYVFGGEMYMTESTLANISSTAFKVDAGGYIEIKDITMKDIAQNAFQCEGGIVVAENLTVENLGSHGIYNNGGDVTVTDITITGIKKNAIQHKGGTTTVTDLQADTMGNHGGYVEKGTLTVTDSSFKNMEGNGFYVIDDENELILKDVVIDTTGDQGLNVSSKVSVQNVTICNTSKNGIYNKKNGSVVAENVTIYNTGDHGISNVSVMTIDGLSVKNTGKEKNSVQNTGTMTIENAILKASNNHGIYNTGKLTGSEITIENTAKNGVYNAEGNAVIDGLSINGTKEHGVNNAAVLTVSDLTVSNTGDGKNNIQNAGKIDVRTAVLTDSKNHGVYNTGTFTGKDVTVKNAAVNGIYNTAGTITVNGLNIDGAGEHGVNNEATVALSNVTIANTGAGKNSIQNSGKVTLTTALLKESKNHGIYNSGTLSGSDVTVLNPAKNGVYNAEGTVTSIDKLTVKNAGDQAINNTGKFTVSNVKIDTTKENGIYNNGGTLVADNVTISNTGAHGVNNTGGIMTLTNANISNPGEGKNGIQNDKKGTLTVNAIVISGSVNHGIYNNAVLNANGTITITEIAKNGIYNYNDGEATLSTLELSDISGHGVNNSGQLTVNTLSVADAGAEDGNSIQNTGEMTVTKGAMITDSGKHGLYNGGTFEGNNITIKNAEDLGLSNSGKMEVHGLTISGKASKAVYNSGYAELYKTTIDGTEVSNPSAEYLIDNNGGVLDINDTTIKNAKGTAIHNRGNASTSVTNVVINTAGNYGTFIESGSSLSGDGLEINNITKGFDGAEGMPIKNAGRISMLDHVTIGSDDPDVTGSGADVTTELTEIVNNAIVNDATTASYSGYDLFVNNAVAGCAIYNKGIVFVTDFVAANPKDGIVSRYNGWATLSGNITVTDASRNPITTYGPESGNYKNGITLTSGSTMVLDGAGSHGINNKGSFLAAADSNIAIKNVVGTNINAVNNNKGTMTLGNVTIDNVRTTITMYNDSTINSNSGNAIQTSGRLTIDGLVTISNIYTDAENDKTDNSNGSGVVVKNGGSIVGNGSIIVNGNAADGDYAGLYNGIFVTKCSIDLAGDIVVDTAKNQGIYIADANATVKANNITVNNVTSGHGVYVNNASGSLTTTGDVTITNMIGGRGLYNANGTMNIGGNVEITGTANNGIETSGKITVAGNVIIDMKDVAKRGIYIKGTDAKLTAANVNVANTGDNAIEVDGTGSNKSNLTVTGDVIVNKTASGKKGININGAKASANVKNLTVNNAGENAIYINNAAGKITATGTIKVTFPGKRGISNKGIIEAENIIVTDLTGALGNYYPIENEGEITVNNDVTVERVVNAAGIRNKGKITINGTTTIRDISGTKTNGIQQDGGKTMNLNNVVISNISSTVAGENYCNGIHNKGTINLSGTMTISNITNNAATTDREGCGIVNAEAGRTITGEGSIVIDTVQKHGIYNLGTISVKELSVSNTGGNGVYNLGVITLTDDLLVSRTSNMGVYNEGASAQVTAKNITINSTVGHSIWMNNGASVMTVEETILIDTSGARGLYTRGTVTAKNIVVSNTAKAAIRMDTNGTAGNGNITVLEDIIVNKTTAEQGILLNGSGTSLTVRNITVNDAAADAVKNSSGTLNVSGTTTVNGVVQ